jgi:tetratricopeptide (TPR) repeat protein
MFLILQSGCASHQRSGTPSRSAKLDAPSPQEIDASQPPKASRPAESMAWLHQGRALVEQGLTEDAVAVFEQAMEADPKSGLAHLEWAAAAQDVGADGARIREHFALALSLIPQNPRAHYLSGCFHESVGENQVALAQYRQAIRLRTEYREARLRVGALCLGDGKWDEAQIHYEQIVDADPQLITAHIALAEIAEKKGDLAKAEHHLREVIRSFPKQPGHHLRLIRFLQRVGEIEKAQAAKNRLKTIAPTRNRKMRELRPSSS